MPVRLALPRAGRPLAFRLRPSRANRLPIQRLTSIRSITDGEKRVPIAEEDIKGPNQDQLPHVSEEAAATGEITGEGGPDIGQGTPIHEV